jgi:hypothetical protein
LLEGRIVNRVLPGVADGDHRVGVGRVAASSRRGFLAVLAALIAVSAYAGAVGLMTGLVNPGATAVHRLPWQSPVLGGLALIIVVALPCTVLAWLAARGHPQAGDASIIAGALLAAWILVELAFIREVSPFHPVYLVLGAFLIWLGIRTRARARLRRG